MNQASREQEMLRRLITVGASKVASALSDFLDRRRRVAIRVLDERPLASEEATTDHVVTMAFNAATFAGHAMLCFTAADARAFVACALDEDPGDPEAAEEIDEALPEVLAEIGNILLNRMIGTLGNILVEEAAYGIPRVDEDLDAARAPAGEPLSIVRLEIGEERLAPRIYLGFTRGSFRDLLESVHPRDDV